MDEDLLTAIRVLRTYHKTADTFDRVVLLNAIRLLAEKFYLACDDMKKQMSGIR